MARRKRSTSKESSLTDKAFELLKGEILRGEFEEGSFLSLVEIRRKHGIGRTPFREACIRLQHEGLLEAVPRRGFLVPEMSFRSLREMFELRLALEGAVAELAAVKANAGQVEELERLAKETWSLADSNSDVEKIVKANTQFHLWLARMTHNRQLIKIMTSTLERTERLSYLELRGSPVRAKDIQMLHEPILKAIRRRDPAAAKKAVLDDISQGQSDLFGRQWWRAGYIEPRDG